MNELFNVSTNNDKLTLSARDLHKELQATERFSSWFKRFSDYGFEESTDYTSVKNLTEVQNNGGVQMRELQDYQITIDMAKEIAMLQRNEKGKEIRRKLIELEKAWNSPEKVMARALIMSQKEIENLKIENNEMKPKALFADAVSASQSSILVGDLAKLLKQNGVNIGANRLFSELREQGYLIKRKGTDWNMPTQKSMEMKLFEIKEHTHLNSNGCNITTKTPKVTGKGQVYFINKFLKKDDEDKEGN